MLNKVKKQIVETKERFFNAMVTSVKCRVDLQQTTCSSNFLNFTKFS